MEGTDMERAIALAGVVVVGLAGLAYVWNAGDLPQPAPVLAVASESTDGILVHVSGAVVAPGVGRILKIQSVLTISQSMETFLLDSYLSLDFFF